MAAPPGRPGPGPAVTFATTEHFNLQTARAATTSEANGRAAIYLAALSGTLIALAFIGQTSHLGTAFFAFALILLPVLAFVGAVTFQRLVQCSIEDLAYARRIARLREYYLAVAPELRPYLAVAQEPEPRPNRNAPRPSDWQLLLTTAGMVAVVNGIVIGAAAALTLAGPVGAALSMALSGAAVAGAAALALHRRHHRAALDACMPDEVDRSAIVMPKAPTSYQYPGST